MDFMKLIALLIVGCLLNACESDQGTPDGVLGSETARDREQEQLNAISEQDDAMNADAGITNDAQTQPLDP
jgi:hypothetical protein